MRNVVNGMIKDYSLFIDSDCGNQLTLNLELKIGKNEASCFSVKLDELQDIDIRGLRMLMSLVGVTNIRDLKGLPVVVVMDDGLVIGVGDFLSDLSLPHTFEEGDLFIPRDIFEYRKK